MFFKKNLNNGFSSDINFLFLAIDNKPKVPIQLSPKFSAIFRAFYHQLVRNLHLIHYTELQTLILQNPLQSLIH